MEELSGQFSGISRAAAVGEGEVFPLPPDESRLALNPPDLALYPAGFEAESLEVAYSVFDGTGGMAQPFFCSIPGSRFPASIMRAASMRRVSARLSNWGDTGEVRASAGDL